MHVPRRSARFGPSWSVFDSATSRSRLVSPLATNASPPPRCSPVVVRRESGPNRSGTSRHASRRAGASRGRRRGAWGGHQTRARSSRLTKSPLNLPLRKSQGVVPRPTGRGARTGCVRVIPRRDLSWSSPGRGSSATNSRASRRSRPPESASPRAARASSRGKPPHPSRTQSCPRSRRRARAENAGARGDACRSGDRRRPLDAFDGHRYTRIDTLR